MARLRRPDGCPWDREQTIDSLKPFVLEETYEVLEAIDRHDHAALCEELGDFVFEAVSSRSSNPRTGISRSPIRSRASVTSWCAVTRTSSRARAGEARLDSADRVRTRWEEIKAQERTAASGDGESRRTGRTLLRRIAPTLPALLRAYHIGVRAASVGFEWSTTRDVVAKIQGGVDELREVVDAPGAVDQARAERRKWATCSSPSPSSRAGSGSSRRPRCGMADEKFTKRFGKPGTVGPPIPGER